MPPGGDANDWAIARRLEEGWADNQEAFLDDAPLLCAALPPAPFKCQYALESVAHYIAEHLACGRFDQAAKLIDELADAVRAVRDSPLARLAG